MKLIRKLIMGVSAIAFTGATLVSTTYAWFKSYSQATISGIKISVNGGLGFLVSVDGKNYKNDLTKDEIIGAMLVNKEPEKFGWKYDDTLGKSTLCLLKNVNTDGENHFVPDEEADVEKAINDALKKIELMPLTSRNGVNMKDLFNSDASKNSGRFIEFKVYFRTTSTNGEYEVATSIEPNTRYYKSLDTKYVNVKDLDIEISQYNVNQFYYLTSEEDTEYKTGLAVYDKETQKDYKWFKRLDVVEDVTEKAAKLLEEGKEVLKLKHGATYEIYLNGEEQTSDKIYENGHLIQDAVTISPTRFTSGDLKVKLNADMSTVIDENPVTLHGPDADEITVYGANAMRLSIVDDKAYELSSGAEGVNIYELNDSKHGAANLGSYATTYSSTNFAAGGSTYSYELDYKYGYQHSASYSYYTNLKKSNSLYNKLMDYDEIPTTIKDLTSKDDNGNFVDNKKITTLSSGEDGKLITFRIWLEGWDADCFDGLGGTIQSQLSFSSKRIA